MADAAALQSQVDALQKNSNVDGLVAILGECKDNTLLSKLDLSNWDFTASDLERIKAAIPSDYQEPSVPAPDTIVKSADGVVDPANLLATATGLKEKGNAALQGKRFAEAASSYEKGIATLDKVDDHPMRKDDVTKIVQLKTALYSNLAQCFLKQELFRRAMEAATKCLQLDESNTKARYRRALARDALKMYGEALEDLAVLEGRADVGTGPDPEELARLRKGIQVRKDALDKRMKEEGPDSDDETLELVVAKDKFDKVVERYGLKDEETANEIADWLTRANSGEETKITLKDLEKRWGMDHEDGLAFLGWIDQGQKFKEEQAQATQNFTQTA